MTSTDRGRSRLLIVPSVEPRRSESREGIHLPKGGESKLYRGGRLRWGGLLLESIVSIPRKVDIHLVMHLDWRARNAR